VPLRNPLMNSDNTKTRQIRRITESLLSLPTLPTVVSRMIELVDNPKTSAASLARLISTDQVLTAKVLKLANSAYYGFSREISTVNMAIVVLGFNAVRDMGLSLSVFDVFKGGKNGSEVFDIPQFWSHSVGCGIGAKMLARRTGHSKVGEAFVAGLLHDVGKVVLNQYANADFLKIMELVDSSGIELDQAEYEIIGTGHGEVGGWLAEKWRLPPLIVDVIRHHHTPEQSFVDPSLTSLVATANYLCHRTGIGQSGRKNPRDPFEVCGQFLDALPAPIAPIDLEDLETEFLLEFDQAETFLNFIGVD